MENLVCTAEHVCDKIASTGTRITTIDHWLTTIAVDEAAAKQFAQTDGVENIIADAMKDFVAAQPISVVDIPTALKMVNDVALKVVALPTMNLNANQIINALQTVIFMVLQTLLQSVDYDLLKTILIPAFNLLKTVIVNRKSIVKALRAACSSLSKTCNCRKESLSVVTKP